jgi:hypothetical protein
LFIAVKLILFLSSLNFISLPYEVWGIFVIKAAVEMQNNLSFCYSPFSRKWPILPGKYMQVLSISNKMADYFAFPLLL